MKQLLILSDYVYAGYCSSDGNKDWAACLAIEVDDQDSNPLNIDDTTKVVYLSLHGPHGGNMVVDRPKELAMKQALTHYTKKCREKDGKAYDRVPFGDYLAAFGRPLGLSLVAPAEIAQTNGVEALSTNASEAEAATDLHYHANVVKAATLEKLQHLLNGESYGVTQKVNGERCLLVFDGEHLSAYNRKGKRMSAPPAGALHLCKLGCPFVIDGERLTGDLAGHYVAFDLLEWNQEAYTAFSYVLRITTLGHAMHQAGLLVANRSTPTFAQALANSTVENLTLLVSAMGTNIAQRVIEEIQASSGEGIVVRKLEGDYAESPLKFKFVTDIDAFVIGINDGLSEGSLKFGVLRPADRAIIEIANVRSGFVDADIRAVRQMLGQGARPVFTITYLPIRTIGIQLVEPRSGMAFLRDDKDAIECMTDQFGPEKEEFIARARPVEGIALS